MPYWWPHREKEPPLAYGRARIEVSLVDSQYEAEDGTLKWRPVAINVTAWGLSEGLLLYKAKGEDALYWIPLWRIAAAEVTSFEGEKGGTLSHEPQDQPEPGPAS